LGFLKRYADTYISRSGVEMKDVETSFDNLERINLREENNKLRTESCNHKENSETERAELEILRKSKNSNRKNLRKMDMFFISAMNNPKGVANMKKFIEKKIKEETGASKTLKIES